jgi:phage terminase large subunit
VQTAINLGYEARNAFLPLHMRRQRFGCIVAHRRAGKTVASILDLIDAALRCKKPDPRFAYIAPYYAQAKDVVWAYVKRYASAIPGTQINESELRVDFPNGARLRLYGADNYDRMRGIYLDGVVLDEFADQPPQAWREVIRPALADRQGWALFIGTPKGRNAFFDVYQQAVASVDWFDLKLRASETGLIEANELEALRRDMSENEYAREMECDFDAAIEGAYYAEQVAKARKEGRIGFVAEDPHLIVRLFADIGGTGAKSDNFVFWGQQLVGTEIRWTNHYEAQGQPIAVHLSWMRSQAYTPDRCKIYLPHDGDTQDRVFDVSYRSAFEDAGYTVDVIPNQGKGAAMNRIEEGRRLFPRMRFDEEKTRAGVDALVAYHEKRDEKRGIGLGPLHNWASHSADAFGAGCVAYEEPSKPVELDFASGGGWAG